MSGLAMSTPAIWCRVVRSRDFSFPFRSNIHSVRRSKNSGKFTETYFGGSRSFKVIDVDTPKKIVTACYELTISGMSLPICKRFLARQ